MVFNFKEVKEYWEPLLLQLTKISATAVRNASIIVLSAFFSLQTENQILFRRTYVRDVKPASAFVRQAQ
jgi:hypothetical protein